MTYDDLKKNIEIGQRNCWYWQGAKNGNGYGVIRIAGGGFLTVHVAMYKLLVGDVPKGYDLDHLCASGAKDPVLQRSCCNPEHLQPVTHGKNVQRSKAMRRGKVPLDQALQMARRGIRRD